MCGAALRAWSLRAALLFACAMAMLVADAATLRGYWRPVHAGDTPAAMRAVPEHAAGTRFDPARLSLMPVTGNGTWVWLWVEAPAAGANGPWVLQVPESGLLQVVYFPSDGTAATAARLLAPDGSWRGHGSLGFPIAQVDASAPLLLRLEPGSGIAPPLRFTLHGADAFAREDARWLAVASASLAIMAAMALMALLFAVELRDAAFVWYALYVLAYAMTLAIQNGYVAQPLGWTAVAAHPSGWGRLAVAVSVLSATQFLAYFADLRRYARRLRVVVLAVGIATAVAMALGSLPVPALARLAGSLINPLLILGGPVILLASVVALWRGSRYAGIFLLGWAPLLAVTVLGSLQVFGLLAGWTWLGEASFVAGAYEALVLSLGLADRSLALRHDRDIARAQAETDVLTGVFNRRGLGRRIEALVAGAHRQRQPLSVLFLDLDRFKLLNDRQGHLAGDAALLAVARLVRADMRTHDLLGRYGGEEFVAVLPRCDAPAARILAERICAHLRAQAIAVTGADDVLTVSVGVASLLGGEGAVALVARADAAMYAAKRAGGDRVETAAASAKSAGHAQLA